MGKVYTNKQKLVGGGKVKKPTRTLPASTEGHVFTNLQKAIRDAFSLPQEDPETPSTDGRVFTNKSKDEDPTPIKGKVFTNHLKKGGSVKKYKTGTSDSGVPVDDPEETDITKEKSLAGLSEALKGLSTTAENTGTGIGDAVGQSAGMAATGATIGNAAAVGSAAGPIGAAIGLAIGATMYGLGKRKARKSKEALAHKQTLEIGNALTAAKQNGSSSYSLDDPDALNALSVEKIKNGGLNTMAGGGTVKGPGTTKSDSVSAKLPAGTFVVPAENAHIAKAIRSAILGEPANETAKLSKGGVPVKLSNKEHVFTPAERKIVEAHGIDLTTLAPNAKPENSGYSGGSDNKGVQKKTDLELQMEKDYGTYSTVGFKNKYGVDVVDWKTDSVSAAKKAIDYVIKNKRTAEPSLYSVAKKAYTTLHNATDGSKQEKQLRQQELKKVIVTPKENKSTSGNKKIDAAINDFDSNPSKEKGIALQKLIKENYPSMLDAILPGDQLGYSLDSDFVKKAYSRAKNIQRDVQDQSTETKYRENSKNYVNQANDIIADLEKQSANEDLLPKEISVLKQKIKEYKSSIEKRETDQLKSYIKRDTGKSAIEPTVKQNPEVKKATAPPTTTTPVAKSEIPTVTLGPDYKPVSTQAKSATTKGTTAGSGGSRNSTKSTVTTPISQHDALMARDNSIMTKAVPRTGMEESSPLMPTAVTPVTTGFKFQERQPSGISKFVTAMGGPAGIAALGQLGFGAISQLSDSRPHDYVSPELITRYASAMADEQKIKQQATYGFGDREKQSIFNSIEDNRVQASNNVVTTTGGNGVAMASLRNLASDKNDAILKTEIADQQLKNDKEMKYIASTGRADTLAMQIAARRREIFGDDATAYNQRSTGNAALINAGISNWVGNAVQVEQERLKDKRATKYGAGLIFGNGNKTQ